MLFFHIAPEGRKNQIDACARHNNVLFVFECKASGRKTKKRLRKDILATKEKAKMVNDGYKDFAKSSLKDIIKRKQEMKNLSGMLLESF